MARNYRTQSKQEWAADWNKYIAPILAMEHKRIGLADDDEPLICVDYVVYGAYEWSYNQWRKLSNSGGNVEDFAEMLRHYIVGNGR